MGEACMFQYQYGKLRLLGLAVVREPEERHLGPRSLSDWLHYWTKAPVCTRAILICNVFDTIAGYTGGDFTT